MYKIRLASKGSGKATSGDFAQLNANIGAMGQRPDRSASVAEAVRVPDQGGSGRDEEAAPADGASTLAKKTKQQLAAEIAKRKKWKGYSERATQYCRDVVSGQIHACSWAVMACQRHLNDLARSRSKVLSPDGVPQAWQYGIRCDEGRQGPAVSVRSSRM